MLYRFRVWSKDVRMRSFGAPLCRRYGAPTLSCSTGYGRQGLVWRERHVNLFGKLLTLVT